MHITFELETALQWEIKVFLFVRHNSHYQMETNYSVFQNFCIHFPFSDFSSPCKALQECCPLQTQNSRMSLTDSKGTVCSYCIVLSQVAKSLQHNFQAKNIQSFISINEKVTVSFYEHIPRFSTNKLHLLLLKGHTKFMYEWLVHN